MASSNNDNFVTHNPFENEGRATSRNDAIDAGVGFVVSFLFFTLMFIIAIIIDVVK